MRLSVPISHNASSPTRSYTKSSRIGLNRPVLQFTLATCSYTRIQTEIGKAVATCNLKTAKISAISLENQARSGPVPNESKIDAQI